jgi:uncharacterized protein YhhL (DUF1145 family)
LWGAAVSYLSASNSITSYIPSMFGLPILFFAILALLIPSKKKLLMHIVVTFGLIVFLGGLDFLRSIGNLFENIWADSSKLMMLITGAIFTLLCIKSFIFARKNK